MGEPLLSLANQSPLLISLSLLGCVTGHTNLGSKPGPTTDEWWDPSKTFKGCVEVAVRGWGLKTLKDGQGGREGDLSDGGGPKWGQQGVGHSNRGFAVSGELGEEEPG